MAADTYVRARIDTNTKERAADALEAMGLSISDAKYRDHDLIGDWAGYRECHIKPDLLLIYRKSDADTLRLARFGSHSELFG